MKTVNVVVICVVSALLFAVCGATPVEASAFSEMFCFDNTAIRGDSGCATDLPACEELKEIRERNFSLFGIPFNGTDCRQTAHPACLFYRDEQNPRERPYYRCFKKIARCFHASDTLRETTDESIVKDCDYQ